MSPEEGWNIPAATHKHPMRIRNEVMGEVKGDDFAANILGHLPQEAPRPRQGGCQSIAGLVTPALSRHQRNIGHPTNCARDVLIDKNERLFFMKPEHLPAPNGIFTQGKRPDPRDLAKALCPRAGEFSRAPDSSQKNAPPRQGQAWPLHRRSARPSALAFALLPLPAVSSAQTMFRFLAGAHRR